MTPTPSTYNECLDWFIKIDTFSDYLHEDYYSQLVFNWNRQKKRRVMNEWDFIFRRWWIYILYYFFFIVNKWHSFCLMFDVCEIIVIQIITIDHDTTLLNHHQELDFDFDFFSVSIDYNMIWYVMMIVEEKWKNTLICLFVCCCIHIELATLKVLISKIMMRMSLVNFSSLLTNSLLVSKNSIINYRMMATTSKYLIEEPKYDFLRNLSIERTNIGVFTNGWNAHGKVSIIFQWISF